jgi:hypothetical protein
VFYGLLGKQVVMEDELNTSLLQEISLTWAPTKLGGLRKQKTNQLQQENTRKNIETKSSSPKSRKKNLVRNADLKHNQPYL